MALSSKTRCSKGFSLLEVVTISVIASIVMLGMTTMFSNMSRSQKSMSQSAEFENLGNLVSLVLQNSATCPAALQDVAGASVKAPSSVTVAAPNLPTAGIAVSKIAIGTFLLDTTKPYDGMYITSIHLVQIVAGSPANSGPTPYTVNLSIRGSKTAPGAKAAIGGGVLRKDIPLTLTLRLPSSSGPAAISSCSSLIGGGGSGGDVQTLLTTPVSVATLSNAAVYSAALTIPATSIRQWVKVPLSAFVPANATKASLLFFASQALIYVAGKGQMRGANGPNFHRDHVGQLVIFSGNNQPATHTVDIVIDDDRAFYVFLEPSQPTYTMVIVLRSYTGPAT